ncbi:MAG TPA: metal ABC transporter permease [Solirubrobacteraceae bacterium]|nr:metal ABC transporter permease [Solirubrobacteraceae bacterium]
MFAYRFMIDAYAAGTAVAITSGVLGWFMVLRRQTFTGHSLAVIGFPGAAAAALAGAPIAAGYFGACTLGALALGGRRLRDTASAGTMQAVALGLGVLFVGLYHGLLTDVTSLLFGTFLGITDGDVAAIAVVCVATLALLAAGGRQLLFASLDGESARAAGVRVDLLSYGFVLLLGLAVAATSELTGALLVFALLVAPAAAAQQVTVRPVRSLALSVAIALGVTWGGLALAYDSVYPVGFYVTSLAFAVYLVARVWRWANG